MNDLVLHPTTDKQLQAYLASPSHAVMLIAASGSGKMTLARLLTAKLLDIDPGTVSEQPYVKIITTDDNKAIGIEAIRDIEHFLSLKVPSHRAIHRVVIIENSHLMTSEAQTALLKTLEEPPVGTVIIMTSANEKALLPTILSRVSRILVTKPNMANLEEHLIARQYPAKDVHQALLLSGGLPGLSTAILSHDTEHPLVIAVLKAKQLLSSSVYDRLTQVDELARNKALSLDILQIFQHMAHTSLLSDTAQNNQRWERVLSHSYTAQSAILNNAQPRLALLNLMLEI